MKHILMIDQHDLGPNTYLSISDSRRNKNWIIQYDTTLDQIIHYCIGYIEALENTYENQVYFTSRVRDVPEHFRCNVITEDDFQRRMRREATIKDHA